MLDRLGGALRPRLDRRTGLLLAGEVAALAAATALVAILQGRFNVANPSAAYLLAVVALAVVFGTRSAIAGSVAAFLLYDFLFVDPRFTLTVSSIEEWFNLLLLLVVGIVCGQLAGTQRDRAREAETRERVTRALFQISRELASAQSAGPAMVAITALLQAETRMERVWIGISSAGSQERVTADSGLPPAPTPPAVHFVLRRMPGDEPAQWVKVHAPRGLANGDGARSALARSPCASRSPRTARPSARSGPAGPAPAGLPERPETRVLAAAADQLGRALERDRAGPRGDERRGCPAQRCPQERPARFGLP